MKRFSIIVPTWGRPEAVLARLLDSLACLVPAERRLIAEVVLADQNTPPLDRKKMLAGPAGKVFVPVTVRSRGRGGLPGRIAGGKIPLFILAGIPPSVTVAKNSAVSISSAEWLLFLDDDVTVLPGCLRTHAAVRRGLSGLGGLGGRETVVAPDGSVRSTKNGLARLVEKVYARRPAEAAWLWQGRFVGRVTGASFFLCNYDLPVGGNIRADIVRGCHWSLGRDAFDAVGGFDPGYQGTALREESDIQLRVLAAGYENRFTGEAGVLHYRGEGGCQNLAGTLGILRSKLVNETRFQLQHYRRTAFCWFALRTLPHALGNVFSTCGLAPLVWLAAVCRFWYLKHAASARGRWLRMPDTPGAGR